MPPALTKIRPRPRPFLLALAALALFSTTLASAPAHASDPPLLRQFCETGSGAGQCVTPRGIATDPDTGHIYVADQSNERIDEFDAWGQFLRAWGWDVVASGPDDDTSPPQDQFEICVPADGDVCQKAQSGPGGGALSNPQGLAVDSAGDVYVVDMGSLRVQKFSPAGEFLLAFGGDVVASGPDDSANDEVQSLSIAASSGTFKLGFEDPRQGGGKQETASLPFDATALEVESALNSLSTIAGFGGSVSVSGGPGDATGSNPYLVTFEGALAGDEVPQLTIDRGALGPAAIGARLVCSTPTLAETIAYQWLRNGVPIPAATSPTYNTTSADEGKAIQCQVTATNSNAGSTDVANPVYVAPPAPGIAPPVAPATIKTSADAQLGVGTPGGQTLTCKPGEWTGANSFSYGWYRNGVAIPGATASTYVTTAADLATPALFQCAVTATNAGGTATTKLSESRYGQEGRILTNPGPRPEAPAAEARMDPPGNIFTINQGGAPEVCHAGSDLCKVGVVGTANGQFGAWEVGSFIAIRRGAPDSVYVGDKGRIQRFDIGGVYQGEIPLPEPGVVGALAVDQTIAQPHSGDLYFGYASELKPYPGIECLQPDVHRLDPLTGSEVGAPLKVDCPGALAIADNGDVLVFGKEVFVSNADPHNHPPRVLRFDARGALAETLLEGEFAASTGIATSSACGIEGADLIIGNSRFDDSFVRLYGPPPDPDLCPPPAVPPTILASYALSVDATTAVLGATINPHFWPDTSYYVEWGTGKCSEGGCDRKALFPGRQLTKQTLEGAVKSQGVFLGTDEPLAPDTTYHYRFIAQSSGGGPVTGEERAFHTYPPSATAKSDCPNQAFRTGPSAQLPDCRAYEMVSPIDKNGFQIADTGSLYDLAATDGNSFTFSVPGAAFAGAPANPPVGQFLANRAPDLGWRTRSIAPPRKLPSLYAARDSVLNSFTAFSDDLCSGWVVQDTDVPLAPGAPEGVPNLYRRDNCDPGEGAYELITTVAPSEPAPGFGKELEPEGSEYWFWTQGFTPDGRLTVFRAPAKLTPDAANKDLQQIYAEENGQLHLVSVRPNGNPAAKHASVGTWQTAETARFRSDSVYRAVSDDGTRIFWSESATDSEPTGAGPAGGRRNELGPLYVRLNPTQEQSALAGTPKKCTEPEKACTLQISEAPTTRYLTASVDGSVAIFSVAGDLFEFDLDKAIAGQPATTLIAHEVQGIMGASEDASRVYLVSEEALGAGAVAEAPNLYLYHRGAGFRFIATLSGLDVEHAQVEVGSLISSPIHIVPELRTSRVSDDGLHAAFASTAALTGYDNVDADSGEPDQEVFLYDASAGEGKGELVCASCNPSGARPRGRKVGGEDALPFWAAAQLPTWITQWQPGHPLSDDGNRLFFESFEGLVPRDNNGRTDVYEWERAASKEDCLQVQGGELYVPASSGCLSLISSGQASEDVRLLDASADGSNVFFTTAAGLLPQDPGLRDIYDARALGGFPPPQEPPPACEGEACQGLLTPPDDPTPASATFQGAGNVVEAPKPRCRKPKVRRHGRCVTRHKHRRRGHRGRR
jgi:hypothetical protein